MRVIVIGLGVQGVKRRAAAGGDMVATVDPVNPDADVRSLDEVDFDRFDAALVCTPDGAKPALLARLLDRGKHVLVEKPLLVADTQELRDLAALAQRRRAVCYTAYNHRFEPHFMRMREVIAGGKLGEIYTMRLFYGNGTARLVRDSAWRDQGAAVLVDLGSHLLDTVDFWLDLCGEGRTPPTFKLSAANRFENRAFDHVLLAAVGRPTIQLEMTLLSWRNHFQADVLAENGSAHIDSLCKWGPSSFALRDRKLPSGRPDEETVTLVQPDPTWALEYAYFKQLCVQGGHTLDKDIWLNDALAALARDAGVEIAP
jgi:scyllo-inositol 2-dehydrogenase (NADP+)